MRTMKTRPAGGETGTSDASTATASPETVTFEFKCRRCGGTVEGATGGKDAVFHATVAGMQGRQLPRFADTWSTWVFCYCPDGGQGIADLIGWGLESSRVSKPPPGTRDAAAEWRDKAALYDALESRCLAVAGIDLQEAVGRACGAVPEALPGRP